MMHTEMLTLEQAVQYEVNASWWAALIWWGWGQELAAKWFIWKARRKWRRCMANEAGRIWIMSRRKESR